MQPAFVQHPYPTYRQHLADPVVQPAAHGAGVNLVFQFRACATLMRDSRLSSASRLPAFLPVAAAERLQLADLRQHLSQWLLLQDAPAHFRRPKLMNAGFTPTVIERLQPRVDAVVERLWHGRARPADPAGARTDSRY